ncbi:17860_t:CDS:2, partial [Gigaspora margarita]
MFNHEALLVNTTKGLQYQFIKFSQKNNPSGANGNLNSLIIPVPPDPKGNFMKNICSKVRININDYDIVNHSRRTIPIIYLFCKDIPIITAISITGHKSESLYHIYSKPSEQQKMDALSILINVVDFSESQDNEDDGI